MDESSSLGGAIIANRALVDQVFGGWPSFRDQLLVGLRIARESDDSAVLELDIDADTYERAPDGTFHCIAVHRVTLRCRDIAHLLVDDWAVENIIEGLTFQSIDASGLDCRGILLHLNATIGGGGSVRLLCASVEVVEVKARNADVHAA